jgi:adenine-specific DNA-methyltransferase
MNISNRFNPIADVVLYEGNTIELLHTIPDEFVRLVITSPPYNLGKPYEKRSSLNDYLEAQQSVIKECVRVLHPRGSLCWQVGNYVDNGEIVPLDIILFPIFASLGLHLRNRVVWHFEHGLHSSKRLSGRYEVVLWFTKSDDYIFNLDTIRIPQKYPQKKFFKGPKKGQFSGNPLGKNPGDVWQIPNVKANHIEKTSHPCQFPVELVERFVLSLTTEDDWVLDPFIGVGSSAIAALIHKRKAIGADIMHDYLEIAKIRLQAAEAGSLRIRPMERLVYDPISPNNIPPRLVKLGNSKMQPQLMETKLNFYNEEPAHESNL